MPKDELIKKLLESDAVASLLSENQLAATLRSSGWQAVHGFYYQDIEANKYREVDVSASLARMRFDETDKFADLMSINVVLECKSLRESNHIFSDFVAPLEPLRSLYQTPIEIVRGIGEPAVFDTVREQIDDFLGAPHGKEMFRRLIDRYNSFADERRTTIEFRHVIRSPEVVNTASAFRELAGVKERDLDSSVLWKGFQGLYSAMAFLKRNAKDVVQQNTEAVFRSVWEGNLKLYEAAAKAIVNAFSTTAIYHPVLVTQSNLWRTTNSGIEPVQHLRFWQISQSGQPFRWMDVVQLDYFPTFADWITRYYSEQFELRGYIGREPSLSQELYTFLVNEKT